MTTPLKLPVNDQGGVELEKIGDHVSDEMDSPSEKMTGKLVGGLRRLSTISEQEPDKLYTDPISHDPLGSSELDGSSVSMCSDKFKNSSSRFSSDDSCQPGTGDECASLLLACLHCHYHELMVLLADTCERAVSHCFPSFKYIKASSERDQQGMDCCNYTLELDCDCCGSCQDAGELIELAMEISESVARQSTLLVYVAHQRGLQTADKKDPIIQCSL